MSAAGPAQGANRALWRRSMIPETACKGFGGSAAAELANEAQAWGVQP
jgi:hypothetical protein